MLTAQHVDGVILMGSTFVEEKAKDNESIRKAALQTPVVILNASLKAPNVYSVLCDEQQATRDAARFLLESGRRRILYLYHSRNHNGRKKLNGYRAAHEALAVPVDEALLRYFPEDEMNVSHVRDELVRLDEAGLRFDAVLASGGSAGRRRAQICRSPGTKRSQGSERHRLQQLRRLSLLRSRADQRGQPAQSGMCALRLRPAGRSGGTGSAAGDGFQRRTGFPSKHRFPIVND